MRSWRQIATILPITVWLLCADAALAEKLAIPLPWKNERKEYGIPDTIVAVWTYAVAHTPGQPPTRGFGGRIMFFQDGRDKPIKVDGTLVVYAFEETNSQQEKIVPDRRYVFSPEDLARCYSESRLGHSYSVWIPWDEAGGAQRTVSLIVCFTARGGKTVVSQQSKMMLPGPRKEGDQPQLASRETKSGTQAQVWTVPAPVRATAGKPISPPVSTSNSAAGGEPSPGHAAGGNVAQPAPGLSQNGGEMPAPALIPQGGTAMPPIQAPLSTASPAVFGQPIGGSPQTAAQSSVQPTSLHMPSQPPAAFQAPTSTNTPPNAWRQGFTRSRPMVPRYVWGSVQPGAAPPSGQTSWGQGIAAQTTPAMPLPQASIQPVPIPR
ncbi:MAG: hypothetical protein NZ899_10155 [Thermoguttaceae bacterium]|nr:hypothetical protein [Thermoguttaceae bacterium]MDW8078048.1 hypothetical protein [Thermoguttaceae bacterium]